MKKEKYIVRCDLCKVGTWYKKEGRCLCKFPKTKTCNQCKIKKPILNKKGLVIMERCTGKLKRIKEF